MNMRKRAWLGLVFLILLGGLLLEAGNACYYGPPPQVVGEITVSDSSCNTGCRQEYIYSVWNASGISYEYVPQTCVTCPAGNAPAMCGQ